MASEDLIRSVPDACDFIRDWFGVTRDYPWPDGPPSGDLPTGIIELGDRLGAIWAGAEHPYRRPADSWGCSKTLFDVQDRILDPLSYSISTGSIVPVIEENQCVFRFGFRPSDSNQLWMDGQSWLLYNPRDDWFKVCESSIDDALVAVLISQTIFMTDWQSCNWAMRDDRGNSTLEVPVPVLPDILIWRCPAWSFEGYRTNADRSAIYSPHMDLFSGPVRPILDGAR